VAERDLLADILKTHNIWHSYQRRMINRAAATPRVAENDDKLKLKLLQKKDK